MHFNSAFPDTYPKCSSNRSWVAAVGYVGSHHTSSTRGFWMSGIPLHPSEATYLYEYDDNRHRWLWWHLFRCLLLCMKQNGASCLPGSLWKGALGASPDGGGILSFKTSCWFRIQLFSDFTHSNPQHPHTMGIGVPSFWQCVCYPIMNHIAISSSCF